MKKKKTLLVLSALMLGLSISVPSTMLIGPVKPVFAYAATTSLEKCTTTLSNSSGGVKVSWNKVSGATGYEIYRKTGTGSYSLLTKISSGSTTSYTDSTAKGGTTYSYYVVGKNGSSTSPYVADSIVRLENVEPSLLNTATGVKVSWDKVSGATGYKVYRKVSGTTSYSCIKTISSGSTLSYVDTTAESGTKYNYYVRSTNGNDQSGYDSSIIVRLENPAVTVFNASDGVSIQWNKIKGAAGYKVFRKESGGSYSCIKTISSGDTLKYVDPTAESGTKYNYYVRSTNGSYQSGYASKVIILLEAPTVSVSNSYKGVKVSWSKIDGATGYKIYRKPSGGSYTCIKTISDASTLLYYDTGAESGTKYNYYVRSTNGSYHSGYASKALNVVSAPVISLSSTADGVKITWDKINGATSYDIYRKTGSGSYKRVKTISSGSTTEYTDADVEKGTFYTYYVKAFKGTSSSGYSTKKITYEFEENLVMDLVVKNGKVIDLVSGKELAGAEVSGEYFSGGTVSLPSSYTAASIEAVLQYNRESQEPAVGNGLSYYGGAFLFQEILNPVNTGLIKVPFGGGQTGTNFRLHASINYDKPVFGDGDSYWCLAFDADSDSYALQINNDYYEKQHWSNYINKSFTLSDEHKFKEFTVYSEKLSREEISEHFEDTGISVLSEDDTTVGRVTDGISDLGSALAFTKEGTYGIPEWLETKKSAGDYTLDDMNGLDLPYTISDYKEPDNGVDHSAYTSVHIIKKPETLYTSYKYALSAVPYPFNVNHGGKSDQYDISWSSSDKSVAAVIDGLVIPKKAGTVTITAKLAGTDISDSCTIKIIDKAESEDRVFKVEESYTSERGSHFSETDYEMTTNAIYDAITEAYENGYNHVVFPEIDFYAAPIGETYYIPTGMTVEFPEGSAFHMMPSEYAENDGYTYFRMGWDWYDYNIPTDTAYKELDEDGNVLGYYCRDARLIIDQYYGEFYKEGAAVGELSDGANDYSWNCVLLNIGRKAQYCSVEVHEAQCPAGFFILMGGKAGAQALENGGSTGSIKGTDFVSGWLDDSGEIVENNNWISTDRFFTAEKGANGTDPLHEYFLGDWEENITAATQRLYDILWYDEDYNLIEAGRWQYTDEKYTKPDNAVYFKVSIQQSELPDIEGEYLRIHEDASSKFCEIKDTNVINGADGLASVVGATEACWIHDNYVSNDGLLSGSSWSLDLEDGWLGMRGTVIENNIFRKYAYSSNVGVYRGMDSGILALSSGYNTFVISNYIGAISQSNGNATNTHIINNAVYTMFGSISGGTASDIRPKIWAHVYYNIIGDSNIRENVSDNGVVYHYGNTYEPAINQW